MDTLETASAIVGKGGWAPRRKALVLVFLLSPYSTYAIHRVRQRRNGLSGRSLDRLKDFRIHDAQNGSSDGFMLLE